MPFIYTRSQLKSDINRGIFGKIGMLISSEDTINEVVRTVTTDIDTRSARRQTVLTPDLFQDAYEYDCPADLDALKIIDIPTQAKNYEDDFFLVPSSQFSSKKEKGMIAIKDFNGARVLQINANSSSQTIVVSELDRYDSDGLWEVFEDAEFIGQDDSDYIKGNGSLTFDINADGGTEAGIFNSAVTPIDITQFLAGTSSFFVWAKIKSVTGITNYKLRYGNDDSNYMTVTVTTRSDGTAFTNGWNLLRFPVDMSVAQETGAVDESELSYFALYMTKSGSKISETDYKFDYLVLKKGQIHNVDYYSKYGWTTSAGAYIENSTADSDLLVANKDEYDLFVEKGREIAGFEVKEFEASVASAQRYKDKKKDYQMRNPSEAKIMGNSYHNY